MNEPRTPDELSQAEYDEAVKKEHAIRLHVWRLHCRVRELASPPGDALTNASNRARDL